MTALYILIPVAVAIVAVCIWIFFWAVDNGQFDDLDSPAHSILFDDDDKNSVSQQPHALVPEQQQERQPRD